MKLSSSITQGFTSQMMKMIFLEIKARKIQAGRNWDIKLKKCNLTFDFQNIIKIFIFI